MDRNRKLAHIVAYYLSRFDKSALTHLGYKTDKEAFRGISEELNVLPNYIKFRRDEFDVVHPHRKGWHKRPMTLSVINTVNALQDLDEQTLRSIVEDILSSRTDDEISEDLEQLVQIFPHDKSKNKKRTYSPRNITGRKAEEIFMKWFKENPQSFNGKTSLIDMRDYGCGYDFQIIVSEKQIYGIEVKGILAEDGGVMITGKEWETASKMKTDYFLVFVRNIEKSPVISIVNNPYDCFFPKKNIQTVIQVNWTLSKNEIRKITK